MASHGIARTTRTRTEEQRKQDLEKIARYRELEDKVRAKATGHIYDEDTFALTTKLLRANPEYYTAWNIRRRSLTSGLLSASPAPSSPSRASSSSSATATARPSYVGFSSSSSTATRPGRDSRTTGQSGTTAEDDERGEEDEEEAKKARSRKKHDLEVIKSELMFTIPLLLVAPKCYWIWNHRLWTLKQAILRLEVHVARRIWEEELGLVSKMLTKDRRNFHAWGYRQKVVAQLEDPALDGKSMVESEFKYTTAKVNEDLSNFSAWHTRSQLIPRLLNERGADETARVKLLNEELSLINDALSLDPEDQSLWHYHQYLIHNLVERDEKQSFVPHLSTEQRIDYVSREIEGVRAMLEDDADVKCIYEALLEYTIARSKIEGRDVNNEEKEEVAEWLGKLRELDPMRNGRWGDVAKMLGLD